MSIEDDTCLLPAVIADSVVREAATYIQADIPDLASISLQTKAERVYTANARFRKSMHSNGNAPRELLYMWMRHWISAWIKANMGAEVFARLPERFCIGGGNTENRPRA